MISHPTKWYAAVPLTAAVLFAAACADNTLAPRSGSAATAPRLAGDAPVGPITGALWTSDLGCGAINKNIYTDRQAVYLNGGPLGNNALNDGAYYVQVTAPDGTLLGTSVGSADAQPFVVVGGKVTSCGSLWEMVIKASDQSIGYDLTTNPGGEYKAWISASADFDNSRSKTDNFKVREPDAPPPPQAALTIQKFYDANADGVKQPTEPFLEGWKVGLTPWGESQEIQYTTYTANRDVGNYESTEFMPIQTNWYRTTPAVIPVQFVLTNAGYTVTYGNVCTGAGGGLTLGYWSNKNGQADLTNLGGGMTANLSRLSGLNLRTAGGADFDPKTYTQYRTWLLDGNATNMAYMLSVQLSAMSNNVATGKLLGSSMIYAPGTSSANAAGFASVSAIMDEANASLGTNGNTVAQSTERSYQELLKNALDKANNNINFAQAKPCTFSF